MSHVSFTELRQNMASYFDKVEDDHDPLVVTRAGKPNVVVVSEADFAGWQATVSLLSNPRNAAVLLRSAQDAREGRTEEHELVRLPD